MRSISEIRHANLIHIIETRFNGVQSATASALAIQPNLVSRWKNGKSIGNNAARSIETKLGLPQYWMDSDRDDVTVVLDDAVGAIVARNLREWMDATPSLNTQGKLQKASMVSQSTIQRILSQNVDASVGAINNIAGAFGRSGYELLMPNNDPNQIPYDRKAYRNLPNEEKEQIRSFIEFVINRNKKD